MIIPRPAFQSIPDVRPMPNLGALLDIPTGSFVKGKHGESILNGGLGSLTGVVGKGNSFKTTICLYMIFIVLSRFKNSIGSEYDTEINTHKLRHQQLASVLDPALSNILAEGRWDITDKSLYYANEWYELLKTYLKDKSKDKSKYEVLTPFLDKDGSSLIKMILPTLTLIDSISAFETDNVAQLSTKAELGSSAANMQFMRGGVEKKRFLQEIPTLSARANNPVLMTAHIGQAFQLDPYAPPDKKLQHLKNGEKIKGVPEDFTFLMNNCWYSYGATVLWNADRSGPKFPKAQGEKNTADKDTDLNTVNVIQLRGKSGPTGMPIPLVVSQLEGVLPTLTELNFLMENERWGLDANPQNYACHLLPDVKMSRTTARSKIDTTPALARAINICSEMLQMKQLWKHLPNDFIPTPAVLYEDLKKQGYDWDQLLATRGWWTYDNDAHEIPFLSSMDLLNMRAGTYKPYWLK